MEEKIKQALESLRQCLGIDEIILVVYNPENPEGIKDEDCKFLKALFEKVNYNSPLFLLSGHGGYLCPGIMFPHIILESVSNSRISL